jgi:sporulation protein YlmC with PRC-barrel domain
MDIRLGVEVHCTDSVCGRSTVIIVDPRSDQVTHIVVQWAGSEFLVPIDVIVATSPARIDLRWSRAELEDAPPYVREEPLSEGDQIRALEAMESAGAIWPPAGAPGGYMAPVPMPSYVQVEQIPEHERALREGAYVEATDGHVGSVDEFVIDPASDRITHLVLRKGHLWGKRDVTIPVAEIDRVDNDVVYLKLDKEAVSKLPSVPVPGR